MFHRIFGRRAKHQMGLWYHPNYEPRSLEPAYPLIGLLPHRMERLLEKLLERRIIRTGALQKAQPVSYEDLARVHTGAYLEAVTRPETVSRIIGYELAPKEADEVLQGQRLAAGGTLQATYAALSGAVEVAVNLGGGFHHAEADKGLGFCIFNDVAVTIARLRTEGFKAPIAIIDLDFHQGNGNLAIFAKDPSVLTYSIHGAIWNDTSAVSDFGSMLPPGADDRMYLRQLDETLRSSMARHRPKLIFYIAGNDVLKGDRLGTFSLTPEGVLRRDRKIVRYASRFGIPLVILMGGGYSPLAWQCTANLIRYLRTGRAIAGTDWELDLRSRFNLISRKLELEQPDEDTRISEADIVGSFYALAQTRPLLDTYSTQGIEYALERYGILGKIRDQGFANLQVKTDTTDPDRQIVRVQGQVMGNTSGEPALLIELVVRRRSLSPPPASGISDPLDFVDVNWLLLQDPRGKFSLERPRLPGQQHPGLGIAEDMQEFLVQHCVRAELDGILTVPSHYHNAAVASRWFRFIDPVKEGRLLAFRQVMMPHLVPEASRLVESGRLRLRDGTILKWEPSEQILPVSERLRDYFLSEPYRLTSISECQRLLAQGLHVESSESGSPPAQ